MNTYVIITTRREFEVEAVNFDQAVHIAGSVLNNEKLIIITDANQAEINYTDGIIKAKR